MNPSRLYLSLLLLLGMFLASCAPVLPPQPTAVSLPSASPSPRPTAAPSATTAASLTPAASATPTVLPSATPTPVPSITPTVAPPLSAAEALENLVVTAITNFEKDPEGTWAYSIPGVAFKDGRMQVSGNKTWDTSASLKRTFKEGQGVILRYQFSADTIYEMYLDNGSWNTADYKRIGAGVYTNALVPRVNLFLGLNNLGGPDLTGNFKPKLDTWYNAMLVVNQKGEFLIDIWDPAAPTQRFRYREVINPQWGGLEWSFTLKAFQGRLLVEEVAEIQFTKIK